MRSGSWRGLSQRSGLVPNVSSRDELLFRDAHRGEPAQSTYRIIREQLHDHNQRHLQQTRTGAAEETVKPEAADRREQALLRRHALNAPAKTVVCRGKPRRHFGVRWLHNVVERWRDERRRRASGACARSEITLGEQGIPRLRHNNTSENNNCRI